MKAPLVAAIGQQLQRGGAGGGTAPEVKKGGNSCIIQHSYHGMAMGQIGLHPAEGPIGFFAQFAGQLGQQGVVAKGFVYVNTK